MNEYLTSNFQIPEDKLPTWHNACDVEFQAKIPVKLSPQESHERAMAMSKEVQKSEAKKIEKQNVMAEFNAQIRMMETKISDLAQIIQSGIETQERNVLWVKNFDAKMKQLILVDEGEIVGEIPLSINEMQSGLFSK